MVASQIAATRPEAAPATPSLGLPLAPPIERRRLQVYIVLLLVDAAAVLAAFSLAGYLYFGDALHAQVMLEAQLIVPIYWTVAMSNGAYGAEAALNARKGAARAVLAILLAAATIVFLAFFLRASQNFSRAISALGTLLSVGAIVALRDNLTRFAAWRCGPTAMNQLVLLDGGHPLDLPNSYQIDARQHGLEPDVNDPHALNRIGLFLRNMDRVIVSCTPERRAAWSLVLKGANVQGEIVDDQVSELGVLGARRSGGYGALVIATGPLGLRNRILKRGLDVGLASAVLVLLSPLLLLTAIGIKLEDRGPILFVQRRVGRGNRFFSIYKFRSMSVDQTDSHGTASAQRSDRRVTRMGRLIRSSSIDELPQLVNVLKGEMSLVGPRPHALGSLAGDKLFWEVDARYGMRHSLKPGLTGLAQVRGLRGATTHENDLAGRLQADLEYLEGWTIWRDLAILARTLGVISHHNAF
ncbi:sugar transferase [Novosphingobium tardum]|uniref:Sugar transferase n=1 Tax=Novosphingobium tardum TaxID=1538021 RepID=A0ABV8RPF6_9SPHN